MKMESKKKKEEELMEEFGSRKKSQWQSRGIISNFKKAKDGFDQLENREVVLQKNDDEEEGDVDEEDEEEITEEDLQVVLMKLGDEHQYCLFCGCEYESMLFWLTALGPLKMTTKLTSFRCGQVQTFFWFYCLASPLLHWRWTNAPPVADHSLTSIPAHDDEKPEPRGHHV